MRQGHARCWTVPQAAPSVSCWHGWLGAPAPGLPCMHSSSFPVTSFSSLRRTPTWCKARRHFTCCARPSPLSWSTFQCLGVYITQKTGQPCLRCPATSESDVCPCCHYSLQKWTRGSSGELLPCRTHGQAKEAPSQPLPFGMEPGG